MAPSRVHRWLKRGAIAFAALAGTIQLVPYGWQHPNPGVTQNAPWPSAEAEAIARQSCYDCHSNESEWPWYSFVAPMSWLVRRDVENGRDALNFSTWDQGEQEAGDAAEVIEEGSMPPSQYTFLHRGATLSDAEKQVLVDALEAMDGGGDSGGGGGEDD